MTKEVFLALADSFLWERLSDNPMGDRDSFYGEYVDDINILDPDQLEGSFIVVEPYEHVGIRPSDSKGVRASENIAWLIDQIFGLKTYIVPAWKTGIHNPKAFSLTTKKSLGVIFEGGHAAVHRPQSFAPAFGRDDAVDLFISMMLVESSFLAICLSHQIAAHAHNALLKKAVESMRESGISDLVALAEKIQSVGASLQIIKDYGTAAEGWHEEVFSTAENEALSCGRKTLYAYDRRSHGHVPDFVSDVHHEVAEAYTATIDKLLNKNQVTVQSFHVDEVAEEAILFYCWAYSVIHGAVKANRTEIASGPSTRMLLSLPFGIEITSSTKDHQEKELLCEVASTAIYWQDRTAQTTQFHPELDETLKTASEGWAPDWHTMKNSDGIRLLVSLLRSMVSRTEFD